MEKDVRVPKKPAKWLLFFENVGGRVDKNMRRVFFWIGVTVARNPKKIIFLMILFAILCGLGLLRVQTETRTNKLWIPQGSEAVRNEKYVRETFGAPPRHEEIVLYAEDGTNILTSEVFRKISRLDYHIRNGIQGNGKTYSDLCVKHRSSGKCVVDDVLRFWEDSISFDITTKQVIGNVSAPRFPDGETVDITAVLCNARKVNGSYISAIAVAMSYYLVSEGSDDDQLKWEKEFLDYTSGSDVGIPGVKIVRLARRSFDDAIMESIVGDIQIMVIGYMLMIIFVSVALGKIDAVESRVWPALSSVLCVILAILAGFGLSSLFGVVYTSMTGLLPYLLLGIGVDDAFIIIRFHRYVNEKHAHRDCTTRIGLTITEAGMSISLTSITDVMAFFIGATIDIPAVRYFCIYAAISILLNFAFHCTIFLAVLALDDNRIQARRYAVVPCVKRKEEVNGWDSVAVPMPSTQDGSEVDEKKEFREVKDVEEGDVDGKNEGDYEDNTVPREQTIECNSVETMGNTDESEKEEEVLKKRDDERDGDEEVEVVEGKEECSAISGETSDEVIGEDSEKKNDSENDDVENIKEQTDENGDEEGKENDDVENIKEQTDENGDEEGKENDGDTEGDIIDGKEKQKKTEFSELRKKMGLMSAVVQLYVAPAMMNNKVRIGILLFFACLLGVSIWGTTQLHIGFDVKDLAPDDHYYREFFALREKYFSSWRTPINLYIKNVEYQLETVQAAIIRTQNDFFSHSDVYPAYTSWLSYYLDEARTKGWKPENNSYLNATSFYEYLPNFLEIPRYTALQNDVRTYSSTGRLMASRMRAYNEGLDYDIEHALDIVQDFRHICSRSDLSPKPFILGPLSGHLAAFEYIVPAMIQTLLIAIVSVFFVSLFFLVHPGTSLIVTLVVCIVDVNLLGYTYFLGLEINSVTVVNLILSIGFSVDYSAHIAHKYMTSIGSTKARVENAIAQMGTSIVCGGFTTFLGIIPLVFSKSSIFRIFFKMMAGVVVYGLLHGLVLLPVILSYIGCNYTIADSVES